MARNLAARLAALEARKGRTGRRPWEVWTDDYDDPDLVHGPDGVTLTQAQLAQYAADHAHRLIVVHLTWADDSQGQLPVDLEI